MEHTVHGLRPLAVDERRPPKACDTVRAGHRHSVARCSCLFFADIHTSRRTFIVGRSSTRWTPAASDAALRLPPPPLPPLPHRRPLENLRSRGLFTARSSLALDKRSSLSALSSSLPPSSPFSIAPSPGSFLGAISGCERRSASAGLQRSEQSLGLPSFPQKCLPGVAASARACTDPVSCAAASGGLLGV